MKMSMRSRKLPGFLRKTTPRVRVDQDELPSADGQRGPAVGPADDGLPDLDGVAREQRPFLGVAQHRDGALGLDDRRGGVELGVRRRGRSATGAARR